MLHRIILASVVSFACVFTLSADTKGVTYKLKRNSANLISKPKKKKAPRAFEMTDVIPQNPNALPGAFFPEASAKNRLQDPPQTIELVFKARRTATNPTYWNARYNSEIAVGTQQILTLDSSGIVTFAKNGNREDILDEELVTLYNLDGDYTINLTTLESHAHFDVHSQRYFVVATTVDVYGSGEGAAGLSLAVSDSSDITDATKWSVIHILHLGENKEEYSTPTIGIDKDALYIALNVYKDGYLSSNLYVFPKNALFGTGSPVMTAFHDVPGLYKYVYPPTSRFYTTNMQPAMNYDGDSKAGCVIMTDPTMFGRLKLFYVQDPASNSPTLSSMYDIDVPATASNLSLGIPYSNNAYGKVGLLESDDDHLRGAHIAQGRLYTTHAITVDSNGLGSFSGDRVACRWYQIDLKNRKPQLLQAGTLFDASSETPLFYNQPAIMTNQRGDLSLCGTVSGEKQTISAFYVGRSSSDPKGILRLGKSAPNLFAIGSGLFAFDLADSLNSYQRWSADSSTQIDPVDNTVMWTMQKIGIEGDTVQVVGKIK